MCHSTVDCQLRPNGIDWKGTGQLRETRADLKCLQEVLSMHHCLKSQNKNTKTTERNQDINVLATQLGFGFSRSFVFLPKIYVKRKVSATNMPAPKPFPPHEQVALRSRLDKLPFAVHLKEILFHFVGFPLATNIPECQNAISNCFVSYQLLLCPVFPFSTSSAFQIGKV